MKALAGSLALIATPLAAEPLPGVPNPAQARVDYMLKCQGCHRPDGGGNDVNTPPLAGTVSSFLRAPGGRAFVVRVPGVAMVDLDDERLAQLVNWTLHRFDRANLPSDFKPYSPAEVAALRRQPLRLDRAATRAALIKRVQAGR